MSFEEAYGFYTQGGDLPWPTGWPICVSTLRVRQPAHTGVVRPHCPNGALELRQEDLGHNLDHNTSLTQESWGMLSSLSYDWHHGAYYPRHIQTSSPEFR